MLSIYDKKEDKVRIITYECAFEKDIFIKEVILPKNTSVVVMIQTNKK